MKLYIWLKGDLVIAGIVLLLTIVGRLTSNHILVSDILFMSGLALLCLMMFDILLHANLLSATGQIKSIHPLQIGNLRITWTGVSDLDLIVIIT